MRLQRVQRLRIKALISGYLKYLNIQCVNKAADNNVLHSERPFTGGCVEYVIVAAIAFGVGWVIAFRDTSSRERGISFTGSRSALEVCESFEGLPASGGSGSVTIVCSTRSMTIATLWT